MTAAETYRELSRRNYEISKLVAASKDLDERTELFREQYANAEILFRSPLSKAERVTINDEEFARAYPKVRNTSRSAKANPWSHRTSGRI